MYRPIFRAMYENGNPMTNWLLYPSGRIPMERFKDDFKPEEMMLVNDIDELVRELPFGSFEILHVDDNEWNIYFDRQIVATRLGVKVSSLPLRFSHGIRLRFIEHDLNEPKPVTMEEKLAVLRKEQIDHI